MIEKSTDYNQPLYIAFINYEKAFDSVQTSAVLEALRNQCVKEAYVKLLQNIYSGRTASTVLHRESNKIQIKKVVRQGDTISPVLFTACLQGIFRNLDWEVLGIRVNGEYLSNLRFADDMVMLSNSEDELERLIESLDREIRKVGLRINMPKTKVAFNSLERQRQFKVGTDVLEVVKKYIYLGR